MLRREKEGHPITFYHYMLDLTGGPCVYKRISGCGSGTEYMAVTPWGDLYPCHQFVGEEAYKLGDVWNGVTNTALREEFRACNAYARPDCADCWAKLYCSGGCAANAYHATGTIRGVYEAGCELFRKRIECAIMMKAAQEPASEHAGSGLCPALRQGGHGPAAHARPQGPLLFGLRAGTSRKSTGRTPLRSGGHPGGERAKRRRPVRLPADLLLHRGSSQCIRAMLYLAVTASGSRTVVAARNVHRAFVSAAALLDLELRWLWPEESRSLCGCPISPAQLEETLHSLPEPPAAVYLTSPDYLGGMAQIPALAQVCHQHGTLLLVDNAHGAYLRFLQPSLHPLDLGADLCCDSAHKTLPVLTGGAYLHLSPAAPAWLAAMAKSALGLFGSTSPLI